MRMPVLVLAAGLAAAPAIAADTKGEVKLAELLKDAQPGKPVSCISQFPQLDSTAIDGVGVLYRRGREMWLNRFSGVACRISFSDAIVTSTPSTQLCRGDIARIVDLVSRIPRDSCAFGDFVPYTRASTRR